MISYRLEKFLADLFKKILIYNYFRIVKKEGFREPLPAELDRSRKTVDAAMAGLAF